MRPRTDILPGLDGSPVISFCQPIRGAVQLRNKVVETIIIISLLPVFPVIVTWFLPWERWVPKWLPNKIIGPYLLFCGVSAAAIAESRDSSK